MMDDFWKTAVSPGFPILEQFPVSNGTVKCESFESIDFSALPRVANEKLFLHLRKMSSSLMTTTKSLMFCHFCGKKILMSNPFEHMKRSHEIFFIYGCWICGEKFSKSSVGHFHAHMAHHNIDTPLLQPKAIEGNGQSELKNEEMNISCDKDIATQLNFSNSEQQ